MSHTSSYNHNFSRLLQAPIRIMGEYKLTKRLSVESVHNAKIHPDMIGNEGKFQQFNNN